jgi:hypothetical protein
MPPDTSKAQTANNFPADFDVARKRKRRKMLQPSENFFINFGVCINICI